jgi:hypothetical protein
MRRLMDNEDTCETPTFRVTLDSGCVLEAEPGFVRLEAPPRDGIPYGVSVIFTEQSIHALMQACAAATPSTPSVRARSLE